MKQITPANDEATRKDLVDFILYKAGHLLDEETERRFVEFLERQKNARTIDEEAEKDNFDILLSIVDVSNSVPYSGGHLKLSDEKKKELKDFINSFYTQPKQEWSEEDEKMLDECIIALSNWRDAVSNYGHEVAPCQRLIDWLKSLRPQSHGKPSEKQMEAAKRAETKRRKEAKKREE